MGFLLDDQRAQWNYFMSKRREIRSIVDPFCIPDEVFRKSFRLTKPLFNLALRELTPHLKSDSESLAIPNSIKVRMARVAIHIGDWNICNMKSFCVLQVLTALSFFASGSYQATVGNSGMLCLGRTTVSTFISEVVSALNNPALQRKWIRFPHSRVERQRISTR